MSHSALRARAILVAACLTFLAASADAQHVAVPPRQQYALFAKILSFDRNLAARAGDGLVIGVVFQPALRASRAVADEFIDALEGSAVKSVSGLPVTVRRIALVDTAGIAEALTSQRVDVVYLAPLRAIDVNGLLALTRGLRLLSLTSVPEYVALGAAAGLDEREGKPRIMINLTSARAEGADFVSALLGLSEVVR